MNEQLIKDLERRVSGIEGLIAVIGLILFIGLIVGLVIDDIR